jgi:hypothetical protein
VSLLRLVRPSEPHEGAWVSFSLTNPRDTLRVDRSQGCRSLDVGAGDSVSEGLAEVKAKPRRRLLSRQLPSLLENEPPRCTDPEATPARANTPQAIVATIQSGRRVYLRQSFRRRKTVFGRGEPRAPFPSPA